MTRDSDRDVRIGLICGSDRDRSRSAEIVAIVQQHLQKLAVSSWLLDIHLQKIPYWDEGFWKETVDWKLAWGPISSQLKACDGFALVVPEWAGSIPPALRNFLLLCDPTEVGHKPCMIISVSASSGGANPIAELRAFGYKNCKILYIPDHVIIRDARNVLRDPIENNEIFSRLQWSIDVLIGYAMSLKNLRDESILLDSTYLEGM